MLPNITGTINLTDRGTANTSLSGAFSGSNTRQVYVSNDISISSYGTWNFNASNSSSIYQNVDEVRPVNFSINYYIKY